MNMDKRCIHKQGGGRPFKEKINKTMETIRIEKEGVKKRLDCGD